MKGKRYSNEEVFNTAFTPNIGRSIIIFNEPVQALVARGFKWYMEIKVISYFFSNNVIL